LCPQRNPKPAGTGTSIAQGAAQPSRSIESVKPTWGGHHRNSYSRPFSSPRVGLDVKMRMPYSLMHANDRQPARSAARTSTPPGCGNRAYPDHSSSLMRSGSPSLADLRPQPASVRLTTFRGSGLQPGVDLDDSAALQDLWTERMLLRTLTSSSTRIVKTPSTTHATATGFRRVRVRFGLWHLRARPERLRPHRHPSQDLPRAHAARARARLRGEVRDHPNAVVLAPGPRHWEIFTRYCRECGIRGSMVTDAYFAALPWKSGCEWVTTDRDYARFAGLAWRHPLKPIPGTGTPA